LLFASQFVSCVRAPILVLHVVHDENHRPGLYNGNGDANGHQGLIRPIEDIAADMLAEFVADVRKSDPAAAALESVETLLVSGLPARRIIEIAMREEAALIVMGTHGRSGLSRLASGSVAADVVKRSPVPVTVVKAAAAGQEDADPISSPQWWERRSGSDTPDTPQGMAI
jgi:nucleotide-binding universal stress UspA family protein